MQWIPRWLVCLAMILASYESIACSCISRDYDEWLEMAHTVVVAIPTRAEVTTSPDNGKEEIFATLEVIDVLQGDLPNPMPRMRAAVNPHGAACQNSIGLGEAYVLFLTEDNQTTIYSSVCGPNAQFVYLRPDQERQCFEDNYRNKTNYQGEDRFFGEECSPAFLYLLRGAHVANAKYGYDAEWLSELQERTRQSIKESIQDQKRREKQRQLRAQ